MTEPISQPKEEFTALIEKISAEGSPVGIDAQYTHAIIIAYLRQICERLDNLEARLS